MKKFILLGRMGDLKYYVQLKKSERIDKWIFNGLIDNAEQFKDFSSAQSVKAAIQREMTLKLEVMPLN